MMDDHQSGRAGTVHPKGEHIQRQNPPRAAVAVNRGDTERLRATLSSRSGESIHQAEGVRDGGEIGEMAG